MKDRGGGADDATDISESPFDKMRLQDLFADMPELLFRTSFDQLRTFFILHQTGSISETASLLRESSSTIHSKLDNLGRYFSETLGAPLLDKTDRSGKVFFTPQGKQVAKLAGELFSNWMLEARRMRQESLQQIVLGATTSTVPLLGGLWKHLQPELEKSIQVKRCRSASFQRALKACEIDAAVAVVLSDDIPQIRDQGIECLEILTEPPVLVTNFRRDGESATAVSLESLRDYKLVLPNEGIFSAYYHLCHGVKRKLYNQKRDPVDDVAFGLALIANAVGNCWTIATARIAESFLGGGSHHVVRYPKFGFDDFLEEKFVVGLFALRDRLALEATHPLRQLWTHCEEYRAELDLEP